MNYDHFPRRMMNFHEFCTYSEDVRFAWSQQSPTLPTKRKKMKGAKSIGTKTIPSSDSNSPKWFKASLPLAHRLYPGRFAACQGACQLCFVVFEGDVSWGWVRWGWWWCWFWCAWSRWWTMRNHEKMSFVQKYPSDHSIDMVHVVYIHVPRSRMIS